MTPTKDGELTGADRMTLSAAMDRMIPPAGDMPGAGSLGLGEEVERMARRAPGVASALAQTLDALSLDPAARVAGGFLALPDEARDEAIRLVESALPEAFEVFCGAVYGAYYADERVVRRIGWSRPRTFPAEGFDETALERVRGRPPFWRRVE